MYTNGIQQKEYIKSTFFIEVKVSKDGDLNRGGCYSIPWISSRYLDPYLIWLSVKQRGIKYHF